MPRSPGHVFYNRLQGVLIHAAFNASAEATCKRYYAAKMRTVDSAGPVLPEYASGGGRLVGAGDFVRHVSSELELAAAQDRCLIVGARCWGGSSQLDAIRSR
jgi:hypothetical protein